MRWPPVLLNTSTAQSGLVFVSCYSFTLMSSQENQMLILAYFRVIYTIGYSLSLASLSLALVILLIFRWVTARFTTHMNRTVLWFIGHQVQKQRMLCMQKKNRTLCISLDLLLREKKTPYAHQVYPEDSAVFAHLSVFCTVVTLCYLAGGFLSTGPQKKKNILSAL